MANPFGFLKYELKIIRFVLLLNASWTLKNYKFHCSKRTVKKQAARCMACGIPFCHSGQFYGGGRAVSGCPNDNLIPEWNDLLYKRRLQTCF